MKLTTLVIVGLATALLSCDRTTHDKDSTANKLTDTADTVHSSSLDHSRAAFTDVATQYHRNAFNSIDTTLHHCAQMKSTIDAFLANITDENQHKAQQSFLTCYQSWVSGLLYFQRPFGYSDTKEFSQLMAMIDTRPFVPGYIDGVPEYPFSGLIHEPDLTINTKNLLSQHRLMDEESASVGFPVLEFFLWRTPVNGNWSTPETRENETSIERRMAYLSSASALLLDHLELAARRWQSNSPFFELPERAQIGMVLESLQKITLTTLTNLFEDQTLAEPEWHHPTPLSGNGRQTPLLILTTLQSVVGKINEVTPFQDWLVAWDTPPVTAAELQLNLSETIAAVKALPANYPLESQRDEAWLSVRQKIGQLAISFAALSQAYDLAIHTE